MPIDRESFKAGMRRLAAGVCVITTADRDTRCGLTATAVCSVSADPPTLLACINSSTSSYAAIRAAEHFAVSLLSVEDRPVAMRFASPIPPEDRFGDGQWGTLVTGSPVLETALAAFDCLVDRVVEVGTHGIMFGRIEALRFRQPIVKPLLYAHGMYGRFVSVDAQERATSVRGSDWLAGDDHFLEDGLHWGIL